MEAEQEVLKEVPDALQRLIRYVVRGFYGREHGLVVDVLVRNACVKEEDIQELMKLDKKQLRAMLVFLKNDKLLKSRLCVETQPDGKVTRHNYYYINYRSVCNIIKYKLHHIHKKIETQERDLTNRASFKCPTCQNTYTDLEVKFLIDTFTGTLNCTFCKSEVEEDVSAEAAQDSRTLQAKFNEQMEPIYKLLRETENINLSMEVLEPEPTIIPHLHPNAKRNPAKAKVSGDVRQSGHWTDVKTPGVDYHQDVTINIGDNVQPEETTKAKEIPIWMQESTIKASDKTATASSSKAGRLTNHRQASPTRDTNKKENSEVMEMLMLQERGSKSNLPQSSQSALRQGNYNDVNRSDSSDSEREGAGRSMDDDGEDDDFEEVDEHDPMIMVAGKPYNYSEVASRGQELVQLMTPEEKENYIQIGIQMYEDLHD